MLAVSVFPTGLPTGILWFYLWAAYFWKMKTSVFPARCWSACVVGLPVLCCLKVPKWDFWKCTASCAHNHLRYLSRVSFVLSQTCCEENSGKCPEFFSFEVIVHVMGSSLCQSAMLAVLLTCTNQGTISPRFTSISRSEFLPLFVDLATGEVPHKSPVSCSWLPWDPAHTDPVLIRAVFSRQRWAVIPLMVPQPCPVLPSPAQGTELEFRALLPPWQCLDCPSHLGNNDSSVQPGWGLLQHSLTPFVKQQLKPACPNLHSNRHFTNFSGMLKLMKSCLSLAACEFSFHLPGLSAPPRKKTPWSLELLGGCSCDLQLGWHPQELVPVKTCSFHSSLLEDL